MIRYQAYHEAIFLGKTDGQDAWIVSDGEKIMLSRSVRRVDRPWTRLIAYYIGFSSASWECQTNFGGRIVPTRRAIGAQAWANATVTYRNRDLEAEEVENYAKSYQGRAETMKEL